MNSVHRLPCYPDCFVCGQDNPLGFKLEFFKDQDFVYTKIRFKKEYIGYKDIISYCQNIMIFL